MITTAQTPPAPCNSSLPCSSPSQPASGVAPATGQEPHCSPALNFSLLPAVLPLHHHPPNHHHGPALTAHDELPLSADGGGVVAGDAGVVAIVLEGDAGDLQGAHELLALDGDSGAREDDVPVLPPGDVDGHVPGGDHAGDVEELPDGGWWELEGLDQWRDCRGKRQRTHWRAHPGTTFLQQGWAAARLGGDASQEEEEEQARN